jgi:hypothetical protein
LYFHVNKQSKSLKTTIMKKTIFSIAITAILASCSSNKPEEKNQSQTAISDDKGSVVQIPTTEDTSGLAQFKEWKQKQEVLSNQQTFTSEGVNSTEPVVETKPAPIVVYRDAPVRQQRVVRTSRPASREIYKAPEPATENHGIAKAPAPASTSGTREPYGRGSNGTEASSRSGTTGTEASGGSGTTVSNDGNVAASTPTEAPAKKDGWSKAAKGGAIGGASGAVIGAVISKNKTKGAVIGGIVGAAGGYIFGRSQDKKDGRY